MDSRFDLKEIWKDEIKRKKIIAIGSLVLICVIVLSFYYGDSEDSNLKELTEIPMTDAEQVADYNNKLEAVNDTLVEVNYFQKDLDAFFSTDQTSNTSQYDDEDKKADSLSRVFANENNTKPSSSNTQIYHAPNLQSGVGQNSNYNTTSINRSTNNGRIENVAVSQLNVNTVKTKEQILEDKRNALKANNTSVENSNRSKAVSVSAVIRGTQTKKSNEELVLKTTEEMFTNGITIPKNTYLYGRLQFSNNRALAHVTSINVSGKIVPVDIELYGLDGNKGIPIQNSNIDQTSDVLTREAENVVNRAGTVGRIAGAIGNSLKSTKETTVTFIDNQAIILYVK